MTDMMTRPALEDLVTRALVAANTRTSNAAAVARALVAAEFDGQKGHGLSRVASYAAQARSGKVNGHAQPVLSPPAQSTSRARGAIVIDACHGFAYPALEVALEALAQTVPETGIAAAAITRSHHCGVVGHHVEWLAERGFVALMFANTPHAMAPAGGKRSLFGTNPIGFAAPRRDAPPVVVDMALSGVARGKILAAAQKGEPIPLGWAVDRAGNPTTDAKAALEGTLLPVGGAKGSALALMVEVLAVAVTGATLSVDAASFFDGAGAPPGVGQLIIAIDPAAFAGQDVLLDRIEALAGHIAADTGARLPGARRLAGRDQPGIPVDTKMRAELEALAG